jgi:hypothetical protein
MKKREGVPQKNNSLVSFDFQFYRMKHFVNENYIVSYQYVLSMVSTDRKTIAFIAIRLIIGIGLVIGVWYLQSPQKQYTGQHVLLHTAGSTRGVLTKSIGGRSEGMI